MGAKIRDMELSDAIAQFVKWMPTPGPGLNRSRDSLLVFMAQELLRVGAWQESAAAGVTVARELGEGNLEEVEAENRRLKAEATKRGYLSQAAAKHVLAENSRLKWALAWAEGREVPGVESFQPRQEGQAPYWWRRTMGKIASGEIEVK